jgi:hypothetical protein
MELAELRPILDRGREELAGKMKVPQVAISRLERRPNIQLERFRTALRRSVELELQALVGNCHHPAHAPDHQKGTEQLSPSREKQERFPLESSCKHSLTTRRAQEAALSQEPRKPYIVSTTRNSALPLSIRAYASAALSSGYFSIIGRTPVISANRNVSSESAGVPADQP